MYRWTTISSLLMSRSEADLKSLTSSVSSDGGYFVANNRGNDSPKLSGRESVLCVFRVLSTFGPFLLFVRFHTVIL